MKLKDEARRHERELQQLHAENLREQSRLKADMQDVVNRMKVNEG